MSSVRMCDRCGNVFSENTDGWTTVSGSRRVRNAETKRYYMQEVTQDYCGPCAKSIYEDAPTPMVNGTVIASDVVD